MTKQLQNLLLKLKVKVKTESKIIISILLSRFSLNHSALALASVHFVNKPHCTVVNETSRSQKCLLQKWQKSTPKKGTHFEGSKTLVYTVDLSQPWVSQIQSEIGRKTMVICVHPLKSIFLCMTMRHRGDKFLLGGGTFKFRLIK